MKILDERPFNYTVLPGDRVSLVWKDEMGVRHTVVDQEITETQKLDTAVLVLLEDGDLGMEWGVGGFFGRKKREAK